MILAAAAAAMFFKKKLIKTKQFNTQEINCGVFAPQFFFLHILNFNAINMTFI